MIISVLFPAAGLLAAAVVLIMMILVQAHKAQLDPGSEEARYM